MDATAQVGEVLDGLQASFCFGSKGGQRRCQQVTESFFIAPPHTSAHLVQVTEAEVLRLVDDNGIGIGYVDATFDDGSGKQHVVIVIDEIKDYLLQFGRLHLSVSDTDTDFHLEQVQDFTPTPMTVATEAWYTGFHPYTLEPVFSAKTQREKLAQRQFFFWYKPEERRNIINELRRIGRTDLIDKLYGKR